jgi:hypothetical protein
LASRLGDVAMQDEIVMSLPEYKIPFTMPMIQHVFEGLVRNQESDRAVLLFRDLRARGVKMRSKTYKFIISLCVDNLETEEAFKILLELDEIYSHRHVTDHYWWKVLELSARECYVCFLFISLTY